MSTRRSKSRSTTPGKKPGASAKTGARRTSAKKATTPKKATPKRAAAKKTTARRASAKTTAKKRTAVVETTFPTQDEIRARALQLWIEGDRRPGAAFDNWVRAEKDLLAKAGK